MFLSVTNLVVLLCLLFMLVIVLVMAVDFARTAYEEMTLYVAGSTLARANGDVSRDQDQECQIPDSDSDRERLTKKNLKKLKKSLKKRLRRLVASIVGFILCCIFVVGLVCVSCALMLFLQEREVSAQGGMQAAFSEAGYQNDIDNAFLRYGEVVVIDKPVLSSDGAEIAPAGSLAYYISDDGQTVRIYKDGVEIAAVNGEE